MTVRISATDWCEGGLDIDDAVEIARAFAEHGAAGIDVSTGQVVSEEQPAFGRSYQTPFADRIRNEIGRKYGVAVIAVGAISSYDDVNSLILAGRADLCALGRTHLYDPQWTLHAAAEQGYAGPGAAWPMPFAAGSRRPQAGRTDGPRPRLELIRAGAPRTAHARWRPARGSPGAAGDRVRADRGAAGFRRAGARDRRRAAAAAGRGGGAGAREPRADQGDGRPRAARPPVPWICGGAAGVPRGGGHWTCACCGSRWPRRAPRRRPRWPCRASAPTPSCSPGGRRSCGAGCPRWPPGTRWRRSR